ncbi:MAG: aldehyde dehydrogenase [Rhodobacteraceae bacterium]|nr:aldehyde dehydrogenase [Paracoccaceae bacterium]
MAEPKIRLALNGFGRIGRAILRLVATGRAGEGFEIVAINDIANLDICAYLFKYDSVYGPFPGSVDETAGMLIINGQSIPFHQQRDISNLDLTGVDLVLECTGAVIDVKSARAGLDAGAGAVLISGPSGMAEATIVLGANEHLLNGQKIVSNASCTTNALGPLLKVLDDAFGVESGHMTTVHCYTGSQPTIDKPRDNFARSRAAALSMVPTTTSASHLLGEVLPALKGRIEGRAIRVPTASVSAIDLTVQTREKVSVALVNELLEASAAASPLLGWITEPLVSTDLRGRPESLIISARETSVSVGGLLRVFGWYDNEWGFSNRMLDMAHLMATRTTTTTK